MQRSNIILFLPVYAVLLIWFTSCVPAKKFQELQQAQKTCQEDNERLKKENRDLNEKLNELQVNYDEASRLLNETKGDLDQLKEEHEQVQASFSQLKESYDLLVQNKNDLLGKNAAENKKLIEELQKAQLELQAKEDALRTLDKDLGKKNAQLSQREARVAELEAILARKDSAVAALKRKVQDALLGFENNGLTIEQKNGKVYVSLDESLLFESGSWNVDSRGQEVLKKLAKVLEQNTDINILVEGHTDDVPYNGKGDIKDNWDLSVKRSTSVVKIIVGSSKVDPVRLTAAGRGEYLPVDPAKSSQARQKNRRTEIILTPKLDELFQLLEGN